MLAEVFGSFLLLFLFIIAPLGFFIWFNISVANAVNKISKANRKLDGGMIWLNLIPLFNLVWPFIYNNALKESFTKEFKDKKINSEISLVSGIVYPIANILNFVVPLLIWLTVISNLDVDSYSYNSSYRAANSAANASVLITVVVTVFTITSLIFQIIFWVNVVQLKATLVDHDRQFSPRKQPVAMEPSYSTFPETINEPIANIVQPHGINENHKQQVYTQALNDNVSPVTSIKEEKPKEMVKKQSSIEKLKKYHDLLDEGLITQGDFDRIKKEILSLNN